MATPAEVRDLEINKTTSRVPIEVLNEKKAASTAGMGKMFMITFLLLAAGIGVSIGSMIVAIRANSRSNDQQDLVHSLRADILALQTPALLISTGPLPPAGYNLSGSLSAGTGEWSAGTQMPEERSDEHAVLCTGVIVILGGLNHSGGVTDSVWHFDPVLETYSVSSGRMPTPRYRFGATCLEGYVYVAGGYASTNDGNAGAALTRVDKYHVATKTWTTVAPLSFGRGDLALVTSGSKFYAIGGYAAGYPYPDHGRVANTEYDPTTNTWMDKAPLPSGRGDVQAVELDGIIYVPGGWNEQFTSSMIAYSPSNDSWAMLAPMKRARGDKAIAALNGLLYVVGGEIWSGKSGPCSWNPSLTCDINALPIHACEQYNPAHNVWTSLSPIPTARFRFSAAVANGAIFAFGGHAHGELAVNTVDVFHTVRHPDVWFHTKQTA